MHGKEQSSKLPWCRWPAGQIVAEFVGSLLGSSRISSFARDQTLSNGISAGGSASKAAVRIA